ncbi:hypothetical protein RFI_26657 [Reticulomyxa filosa]|uniref:Uncharacterized protein n=1 Tax=Reticulomyxa filosa TaxID=46433 RepID=X6MCF6_RETFI|nr:hypothetical protein RFI_26657 [Reticulomyxa filosa]|eukprot:ETO10720.1 hypothetical protein RFI_26657 [Reticulomyxa filosa]
MQRKTSGLKPPRIEKKMKEFVFLFFYFFNFFLSNVCVSIGMPPSKKKFDSIAKIGKFFLYFIFMFYFYFLFERDWEIWEKRKGCRKKGGEKKNAKMVRKKGVKENEKNKNEKKKYLKMKKKNGNGKK